MKNSGPKLCASRADPLGLRTSCRACRSVLGLQLVWGTVRNVEGLRCMLCTVARWSPEGVVTFSSFRMGIGSV